MIYISELIGYEQNDLNAPYWFLNRVSFNIENINDILSNLDISIKSFLCNTDYYDYTALPYVDLYEVEKAYLEVLNNKLVTNKLIRLPREEFENEFSEIFEHELGGTYEYCHWRDFYKQYKIRTLVEWCRENKLPYIK
ncbi:MAG: hypothetical protein LUG85_02865 [Clostridiales bacterium]|nr:hypothetical protein [Clostridiales bacterium]